MKCQLCWKNETTQTHCKTCRIWLDYLKNIDKEFLPSKDTPATRRQKRLERDELSVSEFRSMLDDVIKKNRRTNGR